MVQQTHDKMPLILVVDDEDVVREVVVRYLHRDGYRTLEARDGLAAQQLLEQHNSDLALVILDLMLPQISGLELCQAIRRSSDLPIIMLTARSDETDRIVGLELGADDYIGKPFSPRELVARCKSVLRRSKGGGLGAGAHAEVTDQSSGSLTFGDLELIPQSRSVTLAGEPIKLTLREFDLLEFLARNPNQVFSRDQLLARVWGFADGFDAGTVAVHIRRLREKIEPDPANPTYIQTVWGMGYLLKP